MFTMRDYTNTRARTHTHCTMVYFFALCFTLLHASIWNTAIGDEAAFENLHLFDTVRPPLLHHTMQYKTINTSTIL